MKQKENKEINLLAIGGGIIVVMAFAIVLIFSGIMKHDSPVTPGNDTDVEDSIEKDTSQAVEQKQDTDKQSEDKTEEEKVSYQLYIPILEKETSEQNSYADGHAAVFDVDEDGIDELFIITAYDSSDQQPPYVAYSVYDIENGEVVNRINREMLYYEAGGPDGYFGVSAYEGKTWFHVNKDNGETGYGATRRTTDILLSPNDLSVYMSTVVEYVTEEERTDTGCIINDADADLSKCQNTVKKLDNKIACRAYSRGNVNCDSFADLIEVLKETELIPETT